MENNVFIITVIINYDLLINELMLIKFYNNVISDKINHIEMECMDLLQPMGDIILLERTFKQLNEIESNYLRMLIESHKKNNPSNCK